MRTIILLAILSSITCLLQAQPKTAQVFGSHMVLQRNKPIRVWGTASPGEKITVTLADKSAKTKTARNGQWEATLPAMTHGGPYTMHIRGKQETMLEDILIGEVWVCSGQSNMEWPLRQTEHAEEKIARATNAMIRHLKVPRVTSLKPEADIQPASWQVCSPETAGDFTAVGYFFALKLWQELGVPIGLVNSSWGGTHVETWMSGESFFEHPEFSALKTYMPKNLDSIHARRRSRINDLVKQSQDRLPTPAEAFEYRSAALDHRNWKTMDLPGAWEQKGLPAIDGVVWFRREFQVPQDLRIENPVLYLAMIDDADSTFLNGEYIGSETVYNKARLYRIRPGLLKTMNTIAVKITDTGGDGGIYGNAGDMKLQIGNMSVPLDGPWHYRIEKVSDDNGSINPNAYPTLLYNAMIHPLTRLAVQGVIWYQGESNAGRAEQYRISFPIMIEDWKKRWNDSLPFYFVQLTHWKAGGGDSRNGGSTWAELREAQQKSLWIDKTGMAVITDIGNTEDIHPRNKADVGLRLALQALAKTYGKNIPCESPRFKLMEKQGNRFAVHFDYIYEGWEVRNPYGYINGFEVAGADQKFYLARAWVRGRQIVVESDKVPDPVAVRYCWSDDPNDVNLFNSIGLPAMPFRSDDWPMKTHGVKFDIAR
jgi:sialate O-acetylesterase